MPVWFFFQVENSSSWFKGVRTCAHLWTSSLTEQECKLCAVGMNLSATRPRSLRLHFLLWRRQLHSTILGSIDTHLQLITSVSAWSDKKLDPLPMSSAFLPPLLPQISSCNTFLLLKNRLQIVFHQSNCKVVSFHDQSKSMFWTIVYGSWRGLLG